MKIMYCYECEKYFIVHNAEEEECPTCHCADIDKIEKADYEQLVYDANNINEDLEDFNNLKYNAEIKLRELLKDNQELLNKVLVILKKYHLN